MSPILISSIVIALVMTVIGGYYVVLWVRRDKRTARAVKDMKQQVTRMQSHRAYLSTGGAAPVGSSARTAGPHPEMDRPSGIQLAPQAVRSSSTRRRTGGVTDGVATGGWGAFPAAAPSHLPPAGCAAPRPSPRLPMTGALTRRGTPTPPRHDRS